MAIESTVPDLQMGQIYKALADVQKGAKDVKGSALKTIDKAIQELEAHKKVATDKGSTDKIKAEIKTLKEVRSDVKKEEIQTAFQAETLRNAVAVKVTNAMNKAGADASKMDKQLASFAKSVMKFDSDWTEANSSLGDAKLKVARFAIKNQALLDKPATRFERILHAITGFFSRSAKKGEDPQSVSAMNRGAHELEATFKHVQKEVKKNASVSQKNINNAEKKNKAFTEWMGKADNTKKIDEYINGKKEQLEGEIKKDKGNVTSLLKEQSITNRHLHGLQDLEKLLKSGQKQAAVSEITLLHKQQLDIYNNYAETKNRWDKAVDDLEKSIKTEEGRRWPLKSEKKIDGLKKDLALAKAERDKWTTDLRIQNDLRGQYLELRDKIKAGDLKGSLGVVQSAIKSTQTLSESTEKLLKTHNDRKLALEGVKAFEADYASYKALKGRDKVDMSKPEEVKHWIGVQDKFVASIKQHGLYT